MARLSARTNAQSEPGGAAELTVMVAVHHRPGSSTQDHQRSCTMRQPQSGDTLLCHMALTPEAYQRLGLETDLIAAWEDGLRTDTKPGPYEVVVLRCPSRRRVGVGDLVFHTKARGLRLGRPPFSDRPSPAATVKVPLDCLPNRWHPTALRPVKRMLVRIL
jgi:hypothetical protein